MQRATQRRGDAASLTLPTIHLNGSHGPHLRDALRDASNALRLAIEAHGNTSPHGRDYYPQGDDAYRQASREHASRWERLSAVQDEILALWDAVDGQVRP